MAVESIQSVVAGIITLLQRPNQNQLDWNDVLEVLGDVLRGFVRDGELAQNERRTAVSDANLDLDEAGVDYKVSVATLPDFEPTALQYAITVGTLSAWGDVKLVDLDAFYQYYNATDCVYGAFYGSTATPEGLKIRLNVICGDVGNRCWRITYRLPLFAQLQLGSRPPLPNDFMRMVKLAGAIASVPLVRRTDEDWRVWKRENLPIYIAELREWNNPDDPIRPGRWQMYLNGGPGCTAVAIPRYDDFRRDQNMGDMRGVVGPGGMWGWRR